MGPKIQSYTAKLTQAHRVTLIGGLAIIAHGLSRNTKDIDLWLDPMENSYFDHKVCELGLKNHHPEVRQIILAELQKLSDDGDPFAKELLSEHP